MRGGTEENAETTENFCTLCKACTRNIMANNMGLQNKRSNIDIYIYVLFSQFTYLLSAEDYIGSTSIKQCSGKIKMAGSENNWANIKTGVVSFL